MPRAKRKRAASHRPTTDTPELPADTAGAIDTPPGVDELISGVVDDMPAVPAASEPTALDELAARLQLEEATGAPDTRPEPSEPASGEPGPVPVKRGRGRPRKSPAMPGEPAPPRARRTNAELVARVAELESQVAAQMARSDPEAIGRLATSVEMLGHVAFGLVAEWRGPTWRLTPEEARELGQTTATAAAPYAAELEATMPWVAPCLCLVGIVGKRVIRERQAVAQLELIPS